MPRPSKLTAAQCLKAVELHAHNPKRWGAARLAQRMHVSKASMYKVFDGSYTPREESAIYCARSKKSLFPDIPAQPVIDSATLAAAKAIIAHAHFMRAGHRT